MSRLASALQYYYALRYLRFSQIAMRVWQTKVYRPRPDLRPAPPLRRRGGEWQRGAERAPSMVGADTFHFLNLVRQIRAGADWNGAAPEKLWLLNLHYFDDLNAEESGRRAGWHVGLMERWIRENAPGGGVGWEAYPTSLRIVNWVKWALGGNTLSESAVQSLAVQARYLAATVEWHTQGNHLLSNGKGLLFAGFFFGGQEGDAWLSHGLRLLDRELREEVLPDGGHYERSPMYHSIVLEDVMDVLNLSRAYPGAVPAKWRGFLDALPARVRAMRVWLRIMCHPDSDISFFNDAASGIAPLPDELDRYGARLGLSAPPLPGDGVTHLAESGFVRWQGGPVVALLDVAPIGPDYSPGHAHADTLTYELSLHGRRVIVNSGTSVYKVFPDRQQQRGTAAHNTVVVDGEDSSEVWGAFRVARRAYPFDLKVEGTASGECIVRCAHNGYHRLPGRVTHRREWRMSRAGMVVRDELEGRYRDAVSYVHTHPDVNVDSAAAGGDLSLRSGECVISWRCGDNGISVRPDSYHPGFGVSVPNHCLAMPLLPGCNEATVSWTDP